MAARHNTPIGIYRIRRSGFPHHHPEQAALCDGYVFHCLTRGLLQVSYGAQRSAVKATLFGQIW